MAHKSDGCFDEVIDDHHFCVSVGNAVAQQEVYLDVELASKILGELVGSEVVEVRGDKIVYEFSFSFVFFSIEYHALPQRGLDLASVAS